MALIKGNSKANQDGWVPVRRQQPEQQRTMQRCSCQERYPPACLGIALVRIGTAFAFLLALAFLRPLLDRSCFSFDPKLHPRRLAPLFLCHMGESRPLV